MHEEYRLHFRNRTTDRMKEMASKRGMKIEVLIVQLVDVGLASLHPAQGKIDPWDGFEKPIPPGSS